jgi:hypothetical protein
MGQFNTCFGSPNALSSGIFDPGAEAPCGGITTTQSHRGVTGILIAVERPTPPKIVEDFGGAEFCMGAGVAIAGTSGGKDIHLPPNVRRYYYSGTTHGGGPGGFSITQPAIPGLMLASNPNPEQETTRALLVHLIDWVTQGTPPPPSMYPMANRTSCPRPPKRWDGRTFRALRRPTTS